MTINNVWILSEVETAEQSPRPPHRKFVHGVEILPDGSLIFTFDGSVSLQKFDACGKRIWTTAGDFHHSVTLDETAQTLWTLKDSDKISQVRVEDGAVIQQLSMDDVISANPEIDILELRKVHSNDLGSNSRNTTGSWLTDPFHFNDVDPLPTAIAGRFPGFNAGDLLVSSRSLNLVFVLDPRTLKIKWWRSGAVQRQHDPDWMADGWISIFNNRMSRNYSEIVRIHPESFATEVLLDGRQHDFYTRIRGKHQVLDDGTLVVTSSQQGRAFEVNSSGEVVFEVLNTKPGTNNTNYSISEMKWLPAHYLSKEMLRCKN